MNKPSKLKKWLWVAAISTIIAIWIPISKLKRMFKQNESVEVTTSDQSNTIDSLNLIIKLYKEDTDELSASIDALNEQVSDLKRSIGNREATIKQLKQGTNEKVSSVSTFTNSDIYKLLSDRYKDSTSIK